MAKSAENVKQGLKLRAEAYPQSLTLRLGTKKHVLPFTPHILKSDGYVFVHIKPSAEILRITDEGLFVVEDDAEAVAAAASFKKPRGRRVKKEAAAASVSIPQEVVDALAKVPAGYKISYNKDGSPKFVKARKRRKSS